MLLAATMRRVDSDEEIALRVRNISAGGIMAECPAGVQRGEKVVIEMRGIGVVGGTIAWVRSGRIGVAFVERVDPKRARKPIGTGKHDTYAPPVVQTRRPGLRID